MSAVSALAVTQRSLGRVQGEISSGLRIATAKDNAAYWSIATSMKTRVGLLGAVDDGLDLTSSVISTTTAALTTILGLTQGIAQDLVTAQTAGVDPATVQTDIAAKQQGIIAAAQSASFNGVNWLVSQSTNVYSGTREVDWAGTYADVYLNHGSTPIAYTASGTSTTTTTPSQGSPTTSIVTTSYSDAGTMLPLTGVYSQHIVPGPTITTGDPSADSHEVSLLLTTGAATTLDLSPLNLFAAHADTAGLATDHETFTDGPIDFRSTIVLTDPDGISLTDGGALARPIPLSAGSTTLLSFDATHYSQADLAAVGSGVANALAGIQNAMAFLGGLQNQVDGSKSINAAISDALKAGIGSLVDADMNEDSTRLMALQTQQSLGVQALGIANQNSQVVMKLFGGLRGISKSK